MKGARFRFVVSAIAGMLYCVAVADALLSLNSARVFLIESRMPLHAAFAAGGAVLGFIYHRFIESRLAKSATKGTFWIDLMLTFVGVLGAAFLCYPSFSSESQPTIFGPPMMVATLACAARLISLDQVLQVAVFRRDPEDAAFR